MSDDKLNKILDYFFARYDTVKSGREYKYGFGLATSEYKKLAQSVILMLGIVEERGVGGTFVPQRMDDAANNIYNFLIAGQYTILTPEQVQNVTEREINNFFILAQVNGDNLTMVNNTYNIEMFGPTTLVQYGDRIYAIPTVLLNDIDARSTYTVIYSRIMSMIIYMMRIAQQDKIAPGSRVKLDIAVENKITKKITYISYTDFRKTIKVREKKIKFNLSGIVNNIINPPKQVKPASNIAPPPIQPETGQTEVRPDPNTEQYAEALNPDFIKTHNTVEQPVVRLEPEIMTKGFEDELDEVDSELLEQANQPVENPDRQLAVIPEPRNVVNLQQLVDQAINQHADPYMINLISGSMSRMFTFNNPLNIPLPLGIVAGSGFGDVEPVALIGGPDEPEDDQINERIVADVMSKNPLIYKSELLKEILLSFTGYVTSLYRGPVNLVNRVLQDELLDVDLDSLRIAIDGLKNQLELFVINYPNLVSLSLLTSSAVTSAIILKSLQYIAASLLNTLGLTTGPSVFVDVDNVIIIKDMNGNTIRVIDGGEVNFSPDPISSQTGYQVVLEPNSYQIEKNIPSREEVQQAKSTFDTELYNFIGNHMLSVSKLNMEPTFIQPGYSLLFNISTEIDTLYTALVQGDKTAINQFLPKFNKFLVENKDVILNHVNQPYYPSPDPDDEDDDDISSGSSGSPFPKKPNKFADSKEGEWYIMKTLIYWLMRHVAKIYDYTSVHMQNLFLVSQEIASSIYTTIIGRHPYLFTTGIALTLLEPQFIPQIYDTFVAVFQGILSVTKSVFSFLSSTTGLVLLGIGAFVLLYTLAKSDKKFSLF